VFISYLIAQARKLIRVVLKNVHNGVRFLISNTPALRWLARKVVQLGPVNKLIGLIEKASANYSGMRPSRVGAEFFIDVTHVYTEDLKTGIQRVVRSILAEVENDFLSGAKVEPVYLTHDNGFWHYCYVNSTASDHEQVVPKEGDSFLGLDFNARVTSAAQAGLFKDWKSRGAKISFVVYDILPIEHPSWWPEGIGAQHELWLRTVFETSNQLICISNAVKTAVQKWADTRFDKGLSSPRMAFFHLGADVESSKPSRGLPSNSQQILENINSKPSFLMVSTLEPRKGYQQALLAFQALWQQGQDVNLVIVGKQGWMVDDLVCMMRTHPELGKRLLWLEGVSDEFLERIYSSATCLIAASEGEGFGLPLIEAAQHKLPIIARDIEVFNEVAGEHCYMFSGSMPEELAVVIKQWLELYAADQYPKSDAMPWLTWKQSVEQLKGILAGNTV
jgi:glycosyltransferase involved in cell wall biosynthesis